MAAGGTGKTKKVTHYGDIGFVDACIREYEGAAASNMKGSFGEVRLVIVRSIPYYVKKVNILLTGGSEEHIYKYKRHQKNLDNEILISNYLTAKIPDYVSNLRGAYISITDELTTGYLIYEAPPGMNLYQFIKANPPNPANNTVYEKLYCSLKKAQTEINRMRLVHSDIKPENVFVVLEPGRDPKCKLIDFGLTTEIGRPFTSRGTPGYIPPSMLPNSLRPTSFSAYTGPTTTTHNDYSVDVIWINDFKQGSRRAPDCSATAPVAPPRLPTINERTKKTDGGKRTRRRSNLRKTLKRRSSRRT